MANVLKESARGIECIRLDDELFNSRTVFLTEPVDVQTSAELEGEKTFSIEKPKKFTPVFSEEELEERPELSNIQEITFLMDRINAAAAGRK